MGEVLDKIEENITDFWAGLFKSTLFFLNQHQQAVCISVFHYMIFIVGFYFFFFQSNPKDLFRIIFFLFVALGALCYFTFNRCVFTSIELNLSNNEKNPIQIFMDKYFGQAVEGNLTSKVVLTASSIITGLTLLKDYGYIKPRRPILSETKDRECGISEKQESAEEQV
jgi:hypothetical protein